MKRDLYKKFLDWKNSPERKPLILRGALLTGKTRLLKTFGGNEYDELHYFDFKRDSRLEGLFSKILEPKLLIQELEAYGKKPIQAERDLIVLDEICDWASVLKILQECSAALPQYSIVASGCLRGLRLPNPQSFPAEKVDFLDLRPLSFYEFLDATGESHYREYLDNYESLEPFPEAFHHEMVHFLLRYFMTGGMPSVVRSSIGDYQGSETASAQQAILDAYTLNFANNAPSSNIEKLSQVWGSLPSQLARQSSKFLYSLVKESPHARENHRLFVSLIKENAHAREFGTALKWLLSAGMVHRSVAVKKPMEPLNETEMIENFKIYTCDIGLLAKLADLRLGIFGTKNSLLTEFNGAFVENYVAQSLTALFEKPLYYHSDDLASIYVDFLIPNAAGNIPLEAKSGMKVRSKNLPNYIEAFEPPLAIRTSLRNIKKESKILNVPLYALDSLPRLIVAAGL